MERHELEAWLGPALPELTAQQLDRLTAEADRIGHRYPHEDDADMAGAALSAAVQYLLGETTPGDVQRALTETRLAEARAFAAAIQIGTMLVADSGGRGKSDAARRVGVDRMSLLKGLGER